LQCKGAEFCGDYFGPSIHGMDEHGAGAFMESMNLLFCNAILMHALMPQKVVFDHGCHRKI